MSDFNTKWLAAKEFIPDWKEVPPSLEEIIDICQEKYRGKSALKLFAFMRDTIGRCYCSNYLNNLSFKELWFAFYMVSMYNKDWNNDKRKWEEVNG